MTEALTLGSQSIGGRDNTIMEAASELDITLVASASLLQGQVARNLPAFVAEALGLENDAERCAAIREVVAGNHDGAGGNVARRARDGERAAGGRARRPPSISSASFSRAGRARSCSHVVVAAVFLDRGV